MYYRVTIPRYAYYRVQNFTAAISEVTYAILKNTCGQFILQDLLEKRMEIAEDIEKQVDQYISEWGVDVLITLCRSRKYSSKTFNSARNSKIRSPQQPRSEDWPKARSYQHGQMWIRRN